MRHPEETLGKLMDKAGVCFLSYTDQQGYPVTRAMLPPRERTGLRTFLFSTNTSSNKVSCLRARPRAGLYFVDRRFFRGLSLTGTVEVAGGGHPLLPRRRHGPGLLCPAVHRRGRAVLQPFQI